MVIARQLLFGTRKGNAEPESPLFTSITEDRGATLHLPLKGELRQLVRRGARVEILARHGSLQVRMAGKALQNGSRGQRIRVRNLSSGREISGEVIASGVIQVGP